MIISFSHQEKKFTADLSAPIDISIPLKSGVDNPSCYYADTPSFDTIKMGSFVGNVREGGAVNHRKLSITPHGNGTHTECYSHIADDALTINKALKSFHCIALLISVTPEQIGNGDSLISQQSVKEKLSKHQFNAIVIRTLPNPISKQSKKYSGSNPPYLDPTLVKDLVALGVEHLLIDLPSIDREEDGGKLAAHKAFWREGAPDRKHCTITELVFVPDAAADGLYLLNLQIAPLENDASPSKPVLYKLTEFLP